MKWNLNKSILISFLIIFWVKNHIKNSNLLYPVSYLIYYYHRIKINKSSRRCRLHIPIKNETIALPYDFSIKKVNSIVQFRFKCELQPRMIRVKTIQHFIHFCKRNSSYIIHITFIRNRFKTQFSKCVITKSAMNGEMEEPIAVP